jgi:hypothetical protein
MGRRDLMSKTTLAERVATLEKKVAELEAAVANRPGKKDWLSTVGMFSGDEVMKRIDAEGAKWREREREKARRRYAKS